MSGGRSQVRRAPSREIVATRAELPRRRKTVRTITYASESAHPAMLAHGRRAFHHFALRGHERSRYRRAQCWHVPHAGLRRPLHRDALAIAEGRRAPRTALLRIWDAHAR